LSAGVGRWSLIEIIAVLGLVSPKYCGYDANLCVLLGEPSPSQPLDAAFLPNLAAFIVKDVFNIPYFFLGGGLN